MGHQSGGGHGGAFGAGGLMGTTLLSSVPYATHVSMWGGSGGGDDAGDLPMYTSPPATEVRRRPGRPPKNPHAAGGRTSGWAAGTPGRGRGRGRGRGGGGSRAARDEESSDF